MKLAEARQECEKYLNYMDRQEAKADAMTNVAIAARDKKISADEAAAAIRRLDREVVVYDGAKLSEAIKVLLKSATEMGMMRPTNCWISGQSSCTYPHCGCY